MKKKSLIWLSRSTFDLRSFTPSPFKNKSLKNVESEFFLIEQNELIFFLKKLIFLKRIFLEKVKIGHAQWQIDEEECCYKRRGHIRGKLWYVRRIQISILKMNFFAVNQKKIKNGKVNLFERQVLCLMYQLTGRLLKSLSKRDPTKLLRLI